MIDINKYEETDHPELVEFEGETLGDTLTNLLTEVKRLREQLDLAYEFVVNGFIEPVAIQFDNYVRGVGEEG